MRVRFVVEAAIGEADEAICVAQSKGVEVEQFVSERDGLHYVTLEGTCRSGDFVEMLHALRSKAA